MHLLKDFLNTPRHVCMDNFDTSIPLANDLYLYKITLTGTLRTNKKEIPIEFLKSGSREVYSSIFGFSEHLRLNSYVPKSNKSVILLSSERHDDECEGEYRHKPEIILEYNHCKGVKHFFIIFINLP